MLAGIIKEGTAKGDFKAIDVEKTAEFFHRAMVGTLCVNPELGRLTLSKKANPWSRCSVPSCPEATLQKANNYLL
jgi:hypothetical protein